MITVIGLCIGVALGFAIDFFLYARKYRSALHSVSRGSDLSFKSVLVESWNTAEEKGWHDLEDRTIGDEIALAHSELSEALEEVRNGSKSFYYAANGKPEGVAVEFADVIIRLADTSVSRGIPLAEALLAKMEYNKTRSKRHGGKKL